VVPLGDGRQVRGKGVIRMSHCTDSNGKFVSCVEDCIHDMTGGTVYIPCEISAAACAVCPHGPFDECEELSSTDGCLWHDIHPCNCPNFVQYPNVPQGRV
jgi:hypothetical protein